MREQLRLRRRPRYRSSIPSNAREEVRERHPNGQKAGAEYWIGHERVGARRFHETGDLEWEAAYRNGKTHGRQYRWGVPGQLLNVEPFRNGLPHGVARQYDDQGRLVGTYTMRNGTGIDLWWHERFDGTPGALLTEVIHLKAGYPDGFEWWLNDDQKSVHQERHWTSGRFHGIEREWNLKGRLRRGFPKYWIAGDQVTRRRYRAACRADPTLPRFRRRDNAPGRHFPPEVAKHLRKERR